MKKLEEILNTPDHSDNGYILDFASKYPHILQQKTKNFPFCRENKICNEKDSSDYMN